METRLRTRLRCIRSLMGRQGQGIYSRKRSMRSRLRKIAPTFLTWVLAASILSLHVSLPRSYCIRLTYRTMGNDHSLSMLYRKLIKLIEFVADFLKGDEASLNCCKLSYDNCLIATGGDDCSARLYSLTSSNTFSPDTLPIGDMKPIVTLEGHCAPVNCVSFSSDNKLLVTSSSDRSCIIFNVDRANPRTLGQRLHKLTFSDGTNDLKNMLMRGCFFSIDSRYVYTLATENRRNSYLIKWSNKGGFAQKERQCEPEEVGVVHNNTVTGLCLSHLGDKIGIRTSDGFVKVISALNIEKPNFFVNERRHKMPVTTLSFIHDPLSGTATDILSGSSDYTYNIIPCQKSFMKWLFG